MAEMAQEQIAGTVLRLRRFADQIERGEKIPHKWLMNSIRDDSQRLGFFDRGEAAFTLIYSESSAKQEK